MYLGRVHICLKWDRSYRLWRASKRVYSIGVFVMQLGGLVEGLREQIG